MKRGFAWIAGGSHEVRYQDRNPLESFSVRGHGRQAHRASGYMKGVYLRCLSARSMKRGFRLNTGRLSRGAVSQTKPLEGISVRAMEEERTARASLVWWSQRDLNPCLSLERAPS